jgi:hypothetical protein
MFFGQQGWPPPTGIGLAFFFQRRKKDRRFQHPKIKSSEQKPEEVFARRGARMRRTQAKEPSLRSGTPNAKSGRRHRESASGQKSCDQKGQIIRIQHSPTFHTDTAGTFSRTWMTFHVRTHRKASRYVSSGFVRLGIGKEQADRRDIQACRQVQGRRVGRHQQGEGCHLLPKPGKRGLSHPVHDRSGNQASQNASLVPLVRTSQKNHRTTGQGPDPVDQNGCIFQCELPIGTASRKNHSHGTGTGRKGRRRTGYRSERSGQPEPLPDIGQMNPVQSADATRGCDEIGGPPRKTFGTLSRNRSVLEGQKPSSLRGREKSSQKNTRSVVVQLENPVIRRISKIFQQSVNLPGRL